MGIFTVTMNTAIDVAVSEKDYKESGLENAEMIPAGKGINVSRALKSANIHSTAIALVGEEDMMLFNSLECNEVTTFFISVPGNTRKNITLTYCEDNREHHERTVGFSAGEKELEEISAFFDEHVHDGDWVIFSGSLPKDMCRDAYKRLIGKCKNLGAFTILDTSGEALKAGCEAAPFAIKPNLEELSELTCGNSLSLDDIDDILKQVADEFDISLILATMAEDGAKMYVKETGRIYESGIVELAQSFGIVSSVGCGDASVAGLVAGLACEFDYEKCLCNAMKFANANLYTVVPGDLCLGTK